MKRLDDETLQPFVAKDGVTMVLFAATDGRSTALQADEFALLWAEGKVKARFGYIDARLDDDVRRAWGIRLLPTTLLIDHGVVVGRAEGFHTRLRLEAVAGSLESDPEAADEAVFDQIPTSRHERPAYQHRRLGGGAAALENAPPPG
jgi:hypothetical protein